jgi:hypothetical protein
MRSLITLVIVGLFGLLAAASIGYAAYVVSRDTVGTPVTKVKLSPNELAPVRERPRTTPRTTATTTTRATPPPPAPPPPPATTVESGDDHGGGDDDSGRGRGRNRGRGGGGGDDD